MTLIHGFIPMALIPHGMQTLANVINLNISEWSSITLTPLKDSHLPKDALD
jgi:hypothetical protein